MSGQNNRNRKFQDFVNANKIVDDAVGIDELGALQEKTKVFLYDFGVLGGGAGAKTLTDSDGNAATLPDNALVSKITIDVVTPLASSGSATVALGVVTDGASNFKGATAFDNGAYVAATQVPFLPAVGKKLTGARSVIATIATAALTAGKFFLYVSYYEGN